MNCRLRTTERDEKNVIRTFASYFDNSNQDGSVLIIFNSNMYWKVLRNETRVERGLYGTAKLNVIMVVRYS